MKRLTVAWTETKTYSQSFDVDDSFDPLDQHAVWRTIQDAEVAGELDEEESLHETLTDVSFTAADVCIGCGRTLVDDKDVEGSTYCDERLGAHVGGDHDERP